MEVALRNLRKQCAFTVCVCTYTRHTAHHTWHKGLPWLHAGCCRQAGTLCVGVSVPRRPRAHAVATMLLLRACVWSTPCTHVQHAALGMCVCVRACVGACAHARVCVRALCPQEYKAALKALMRYTANIVKHPEEPKYKCIRTGNMHYRVRAWARVCAGACARYDRMHACMGVCVCRA